MCVYVQVVYLSIWDCFQEKGPRAYIINSSTRNRNVTPALKCMANYTFRAVQLHDRYSDSQCVREGILDKIENLKNHALFAETISCL